ncbi:alginate lyase family protein [Mucilaginibacter daejeonensis]|uniref:alginate lyase family protein n=1 Tax=Mucilaginibacter daejeonensis TaxID=398049 RepID=UPI001D174F3D|nr:alginate lyase family protein [Mucilaginibacter daejeonensis]UEG54174.1 alginate lyase family protein [Mucilaginibacter daejeonensis]
MRKAIAPLLLLIGMTVTAQAQFVSLTAGEVKKLKQAIDTDHQVKRQFEVFEKTARKALAETPGPVALVHSQGLLMGDPVKTASLKAVEDGPKVYALALCSRLYDNRDYLKKAIDYLLAWAKVNKPNGDPIDETKLEEFFTGYDLIRDQISKADRKLIDTWMESIAVAEINSPFARPDKSTAKNNWNSHRIKVIAQVVYAIHADRYRDTVNKLVEQQLVQNLYEDGSSYDFAERDALHYHIYTLEPLLKAMIAVQRGSGKNYYAFVSPTGSSVQRSVQFLLPFVTGVKKHGEFANSKVKFDRDRAANGEKGYVAGHPFEPKNGIIVLSLADHFDPLMVKVVKQVMGDQYLDWQLVLNRVQKAK